MINVRWHGRGGGGVVTAARLLGVSTVYEGLYALSFPTFGPERRGAPVQAFTKVSKSPIRDRTQVYEPDHVVIMDSSLLNTVDVLQGLSNRGLVVINSQNEKIKDSLPQGLEVITVDATGIALKHMGVPIINTAMLGSYCAATGLIKLGSLLKAIADELTEKAKGNIEAAEEAYFSVRRGVNSCQNK